MAQIQGKFKAFQDDGSQEAKGVVEANLLLYNIDSSFQGQGGKDRQSFMASEP